MVVVAELPIGKGKFKGSSSFLIAGLENFSLEQMYDSGQSFRFFKDEENLYTVLSAGEFCKIRQLTDENVELLCLPERLEFWLNYFDIRTYGENVKTYTELTSKIQNLDVQDSSQDALVKSLEYSSGTRILRQDFFETLVSRVISPMSGTNRIRVLVETLCERYGTFNTFKSGDYSLPYYAFPTPKELSKFTHISFSLRLGLSEFNANALSNVLEWLKENWDGKEVIPCSRLKEIKGIGPKISSRVGLYSYHNLDDTPFNLYVGSNFKPYRGICQQYIYGMKEKTKK